ncbi:hypothetical protein [Streptomyces sp. NBC_00425]
MKHNPRTCPLCAPLVRPSSFGGRRAVVAVRLPRQTEQSRKNGGR